MGYHPFMDSLQSAWEKNHFHIKIFGVRENNFISTNPFVLSATRISYYPVRIIKPLYAKKTFSYKHIFFKYHQISFEQIVTDNT